jgi:hypothetical protein
VAANSMMSSMDDMVLERQKSVIENPILESVNSYITMIYGEIQRIGQEKIQVFRELLGQVNGFKSMKTK